MAWPSVRKFAMATAEITLQRVRNGSLSVGGPHQRDHMCRAHPATPDRSQTMRPANVTSDRIAFSFRGSGSHGSVETGHYDGKVEPRELLAPKCLQALGGDFTNDLHYRAGLKATCRGATESASRISAGPTPAAQCRHSLLVACRSASSRDWSFVRVAAFLRGDVANEDFAAVPLGVQTV
jgi:hypothetical protein